MNRAFLYIDILGFGELVKTNSSKVEKIFSIIDGFKVHSHFALQTVVFSDTILVFNKDKSYPIDYYITYLIEYAQELFYKLSAINIYFKGVLTYGDFKFAEMTNIQAYYGLALIETYKDESILEGFGLYVDKRLSNDIVVFDSVPFTEKYDFVLLCQYLKNLYKRTQGVLPIEDVNILYDTDTFYRIDEDLRFLREIEYLKNNHPKKKIRVKYQKVYDTYKTDLPLFFNIFEKEGFLPSAINENYMGSINPFELLAEQELNVS